MTGEEIFCLWHNYRFRIFVIDCANQQTGDERLRKCLIAKAWEVLSNTKPQKTLEFYKKMVSIIIKRETLLYCNGEKRLQKVG